MPPVRFLPVLLAGALAGCSGDAEKPRLQPEPAGPVIRDGSLMVPGSPRVTGLPAVVAPGRLAVKWSMWWGENGRRWALYVNGQQAEAGELRAASPNQQDGQVEVQFDKPGQYEIKVALCNDHGCSESEPALLEVSPS